jgi:hypothetical protein
MHRRMTTGPDNDISTVAHEPCRLLCDMKTTLVLRQWPCGTYWSSPLFMYSFCMRHQVTWCDSRPHLEPRLLDRAAGGEENRVQDGVEVKHDNRGQATAL